MVDDSFEYGRMRSGAHITKLLLDLIVLSAVLCLRARQKRASIKTLACYGTLLMSIFVASLVAGIGLSYSRVDKTQLREFNAAFVPLVLVWTLLTDLAPNASKFTDDAGREIPSSMRLSTETKYYDDDDKEQKVGAFAYVFNQREIIGATVLILCFYGTIRYFYPPESSEIH